MSQKDLNWLIARLQMFKPFIKGMARVGEGMMNIFGGGHIKEINISEKEHNLFCSFTGNVLKCWCCANSIYVEDIEAHAVECPECNAIIFLNWK